MSSELYPEDPVWFTNPPDSSEIRYRLTEATLAETPVQNSAVVFHVDPSQTFQTMLGIGTSLEETTVYAMLKNKSDDQTKAILRRLIDPAGGIGMSLFRITIGTSDFSDGRAVSDHPQGFYSYQENPQQPFSIQNDIDLGIIKVLNMAQEVAADCGQQIRFFASPWSPPPWMKTSNSLIGGTLKKGFEKQLAQYLRRFIEAYAAQGIPVYAMTLQNEANFTPRTYPGMKLSWKQERDLALAAYNEFQKTPRLETKIWIIDHNFEYWKKADRILSSLEKIGAKHVVDAVAFHDYSNAKPAAMGKLKMRHPGVGLQFSEMSKFGVKGMADIQRYFVNGAQSYVYWVTMSTQNPTEHIQGPYNSLDMLSPTLFIQLNGDTPDYVINADYYLLGQFSRYIRPGAVRIGCDFGDECALTAVAFQNPDGAIVVVLVNQTAQQQPFRLEREDHTCSGHVAPKSVATVVMN